MLLKMSVVAQIKAVTAKAISAIYSIELADAAILGHRFILSFI